MSEVFACQYCYELIASDPEYGAVFECLAYKAARGAYGFVSVSMTSGIVNELKVVDIAHYDTEFEVILQIDPVIDGIGIFLECRMIFDPGQFVAPCHSLG